MKKPNEPIQETQPDIELLQKEIEELKEQVEQKQSLYLRALADYHNLEKRSQDEHKNLLQHEQARILREVIGIKEDVDKAASFDKNPATQLISQKFNTLLSRFNVKELDVMGKEFSPETMECIEVVEGPEDNVVTAIHEKGYMLNTMLLKPARVAVSKLSVSPVQGVN